MLTRNRTLREGLVVGLIAYASVALFYSVFDFLAARGTLYTVNLLGRAVFRGLRDAGVLQYPVQVDMMAVFWYNLLHLAIALAIGVIVTRLVDQGEQNPSQAPFVLFVILAGFIVTILAVGLLTEPIRPLLPWWSIVAANALASLVAGWYLIRQRPGVLQHLVPLTH
jgi:hypothetical protein